MSIDSIRPVDRVTDLRPYSITDDRKSAKSARFNEDVNLYQTRTYDNCKWPLRLLYFSFTRPWFDHYRDSAVLRFLKALLCVLVLFVVIAAIVYHSIERIEEM